MNRMVAFVLALAFFPLMSTPLVATDLTKIDRTIAKEPTYKTKPKYCLLVFGPEAKHRVWLVLDGDTLYVDCNGNGDLSEAEDKIAAEKRDPGDEFLTFKVREIPIGGQIHRDLNLWVPKLDCLADRDSRAKSIVAKDPQARAYLVSVEVEMPGWKGTGIGGRIRQSGFPMDASGVLQFADRPKDAPILHFGGALEVALFGRHELKIGRESEIVLGVGSPGVGPGTHTWLDYEKVIPENAYPTLEIVYPSKKLGDAPVREKHELKQRC